MVEDTAPEGAEATELEAPPQVEPNEGDEPTVDEIVQERLKAEDELRAKLIADKGNRTRSLTVDFFERGAPEVTFWGKFDGPRTSVAMNAIGKAWRRRRGRHTLDELLATEAEHRLATEQNEQMRQQLKMKEK